MHTSFDSRPIYYQLMLTWTFKIYIFDNQCYVKKIYYETSKQFFILNCNFLCIILFCILTTKTYQMCNIKRIQRKDWCNSHTTVTENWCNNHTTVTHLFVTAKQRLHNKNCRFLCFCATEMSHSKRARRLIQEIRSHFP